MDMKMKPLMIAVALALGASSGAFAQTGTGSALNPTMKPGFDSQETVAGKAVPGSPQKPMNGSTADMGTMTGRGANTMQPGDTKAGTTTGVTRTDGTVNSKTNGAFDSQEKVDGRVAPGSPTSSVNGTPSSSTGMHGMGTGMMNDKSSTAGGVADEHASTTGKTGSAHAATTAKQKKAAHARNMHTTAKSTSTTGSRAGADAQNSDQHRTDEPFRDDVGRLPGVNPATSSTSTAK